MNSFFGFLKKGTREEKRDLVESLHETYGDDKKFEKHLIETLKQMQKKEEKVKAEEKKKARLGIVRGNSASPDDSGFINLSKTPKIYGALPEQYNSDNYQKRFGRDFKPPSISPSDIDENGNIALGLKKRSKTRKLSNKKHKTYKRNKKSKKGKKSKTYKKK
jgi:hypothetical protein